MGIPLVGTVRVLAQLAKSSDHVAGIHVCIIICFQHEFRVYVRHYPLHSQEHLQPSNCQVQGFMVQGTCFEVQGSVFNWVQ